MLDDIVSPIDLCDMAQAREWESTAMGKRPWRIEFFECFARQLVALQDRQARVLELGSGPGFLSRYLLSGMPDLAYTALDVSAAMHALAADRLGHAAAQVRFIERNFRDGGWANDLGQFDAVITMQAVHELRHKRHAVALHEAVHQLLAPGGLYLVCDHYAGDDGMHNAQLYMTPDEQREALIQAGFAHVTRLHQQRGLVLYQAQRPAAH